MLNPPAIAELAWEAHRVFRRLAAGEDYLSSWEEASGAERDVFMAAVGWLSEHPEATGLSFMASWRPQLEGTILIEESAVEIAANSLIVAIVGAMLRG